MGPCGLQRLFGHEVVSLLRAVFRRSSSGIPFFLQRRIADRLRDRPSRVDDLLNIAGLGIAVEGLVVSLFQHFYRFRLAPIAEIRYT